VHIIKAKKNKVLPLRGKKSWGGGFFFYYFFSQNLKKCMILTKKFRADFFSFFMISGKKIYFPKS